MVLQELIMEFNEIAPLRYAESWDNSGLICGRYSKEVRNILVTVDVTDEVVWEAVQTKADLILAHHPLIFSPIQRVTDDDFIGRRLLSLIQSDIACYAMHTNYDVCRMADVAARQLGIRQGSVFKDLIGDGGGSFGDEFSFSYRVLMQTREENGVPQGIGRVGEFPVQQSLAECADKVKKAYGLKSVRMYGDPGAKIRRVAVSPGSGKRMAGYAIAAGADVLIAGDIDHHEGIDAVAQGLCVIDTGHYGIEKLFMSDMRDLLKQRLPVVTATIASQKEPFIDL